MERREYIDKMASQLKVLDDKITVMQNNAQEVKSNLKEEYQKQLNILNQKKEQTKEKLAKLNESNHEAFDTLKEGISKSFTELKEAVETAVKKYKSNGNS